MVVIVVIVSTVFYISSKRQQKIDAALEEQFSLTSGRVTFFGYDGIKVSLNPRFSFNVQEVKYEVNFAEDKICDLVKSKREEVLWGVNFPVAYYPKDPNLARIILSEEDHKRFGVSMDSLPEVRKRFLHCE